MDGNGRYAEERAASDEAAREPRGLNYGLDFGRAIIALKAGQRVAREGWNGKGMWLVLLKPKLYGGLEGDYQGMLDMSPCIGMKTASARGEMQPGWLASQADMLAEDWCIVSEKC